MPVYRVQVKDYSKAQKLGIRVEYILKAYSMIEAIELVKKKENEEFKHIISIEMAELLPGITII